MLPIRLNKLTAKKKGFCCNSRTLENNHNMETAI